MDWVREYHDTFYIEKEFEGYTYKLRITAYSSNKSVKFWVAASSGKKRKEKDIYKDKENKSLGGMKALMWLKEMMYAFPAYYNKYYPFEANKKQYLQIHWADSRRRDIYQRLLKEGFQFIVDSGQKLLMKKL